LPAEETAVVAAARAGDESAFAALAAASGHGTGRVGWSVRSRPPDRSREGLAGDARCRPR